MRKLLLGLRDDEITAEQRDALRALAPDTELVVTADRARIEALLEDVSIAAGPIGGELVARAPQLRWYQQWGAGADWLLDYPELVERDLIITNVAGIHAIPISEHILALLLGFARAIPASQRAQLERRWAKGDERALFELAGKTMLIVGLGAIGARTAQLAGAFGMRVIGVRRRGGEPVPGVERVVGPEELHAVLPEADAVVLLVPLTRATAGLIGARELGLMKPSAYLVNVGRGATVDEPSLVRALAEGRIAGAGLDVFATEPLPQDSPLWTMRNVVITPHYAGSTPHYHERAMAIFLDNLERYQQGQPLRNVVDKQHGY
jgi:D-2-hydroxyacid dehydrogenase (NADP+)